MTFLELVNFVRSESGDTSSDLSALSSVTGENLRIKNWVIRSWNEIQDLHDDWKWMRGTYSFTTTADQGAYTSAQSGISSRFRFWDKTYCTAYLTAVGVTDQIELRWLEYEVFRANYLTGSQTSGRPEHFTVGLSNELIVGPEPVSTGYTIAGQYAKSRQELSADTDEPEVPELHEIIAWRALMKYGRYESAQEVYADARMQYRALLSKLRNKYLPMISLCGPLA